tara:strand:- start:448 stop:1755 length:1308 start_codon:yes stop_codon:yes gene_type:complete
MFDLKDHQGVWRLAGPIMISNVSVPLLGAVDTAVMGHLPDPSYLGGVAIGALIFSFLYWGFGFLKMGTGGLTAQALGAGDQDEVKSCLARSLIIGIPLGVIIILLQVPLSFLSFYLVEASQEVENLGGLYFETRIWGAPATLANFALVGWFVGMQNTKMALVHQLFLNSVNILLDLLFVIGFGWGVEGVAAATAIADILAFGFGLLLALAILRRSKGQFLRHKIFNIEVMRRVFSLNFDIFIRTICLVSAFALFTAKGAAFGNILLASNAILINFQTFMAHALDGLAHAAEAQGGKAFGARDREAFKKAVRLSLFWGAIVAIGFTLVYFLTGKVIIYMLTDIDEIRDMAEKYLIWSVLMPVISVLAYVMDGIFLGATQGRTIRNAMSISFIIFIFAVYLFVPVMGNHGLWGALMLFMLVRGLTLLFCYKKLETSI